MSYSTGGLEIVRHAASWRIRAKTARVLYDDRANRIESSDSRFKRIRACCQSPVGFDCMRQEAVCGFVCLAFRLKGRREAACLLGKDGYFIEVPCIDDAMLLV
jgi:hypothetical protein